MAADNPFKSPAAKEGSSVSQIQRPWLRRLLALGAAGLTVAILSLIYGVLLVGIPSQDPTPEMARREAFHLTVSKWGAAIGCGITLIAIVGFASVLIARGIKRLVASSH